MIVDDETDLRDMLNLLLVKEGFETTTAEDGQDFLNKIDDFQPDLVTLDVMMPGLTTKEILEKIQTKETKPKIILLTVVRFSDEEKTSIFKKGNIVDYINKPFEIDDFTGSVRKHLSPC